MPNRILSRHTDQSHKIPASLKYAVLMVGTVLMVSGPSPSFAGFEFISPPAPAPSSVVQDSSPAPALGHENDLPLPSGPLTPEPVIQDSSSVSSAPLALTAMDQVAALPIEPLPEGVLSEQDLMETPPTATRPEHTANPDLVMGFGKNIPLAVALTKIAPKGYVFEFESGIDEGKPVSWDGRGRVWAEVLNETLSLGKLHAQLQGNKIMIAKGAGPLLPVPSAHASGPELRPADMNPQDQLPGRPVDLGRSQNWQVATGMSLRQALQSWSLQAGVILEWNSALDYPLNNNFSTEGNFAQAVESLLTLYAGEDSPPKGKLYPNAPTGPSYLVVN
jgi:hypothetical protein